jgi:hypothetical protein
LVTAATQASRERIASVLETQSNAQKEKRRLYEERVKVHEERRREKLVEEEQERTRQAKRVAEDDKKRHEAYEGAKLQHT